jgi:hypothetical protein
MRSLFLVKSCDLHPSSQYILVRVIPSCFYFARMCLCQVSLPSRCSLIFLTFPSWESCTLFIWGGAQFSSCSDWTLTNLDPLAFILHFLTPVLDCSFCEAVAGTLSVASTAVLSTKDAVVYGEVGRSAMYSRYNNGPRAL